MSFVPSTPWPRITVVICVYNGMSTIAACLASVAAIDYPDFETIVVDDGSTDGTREFLRAAENIRLIELPKNEGLSAARNAGMRAATGEIVAYLDSDAFATPSWLRHLAEAFLSTTHSAIGGPNINPPASGFIAGCVDKAPGSPMPVIFEDGTVDHLPGCNLALRRPLLEALDGFDVGFRVAGDDVDLCWRVRQCGATLGFAPNAIVHHCRRDTVRGFLKQQRGYGRAEALLYRKWPEKYNRLGHVSLDGTLYGLYRPSFKLFTQLPLIPEWYLLVAFTALAAPFSRVAFWGIAVELVYSLGYAAFHARGKRAAYFVTAALYLLQPLARLRGRLEYGLTPWSAWFPAKTEK